MKTLTFSLVLAGSAAGGFKAIRGKAPEISPLDRYITEARSRAAAQRGATPGSLWTDAGPLADMARDFRASRVDDVVTVVVAERATASAKGDTKSSRKSDLSSGVSSIGGKKIPTLADLARLSTDAQLQGQGATTRESTLTATLAGRVAALLPNGNLVVEAAKETWINSERQIVTVRGVARPEDISPGNLLRSERLAQLEVRINGRGVVADAVRRPNFLYRLLLGVLPF